MLQFCVPCLLGLEKLVADELKKLNLQDVRAENGRVFCKGSFLDMARMNLNLRTGERVLLVLGSFPTDSFTALFDGTKALPWEQYLVTPLT